MSGMDIKQYEQVLGKLFDDAIAEGVYGNEVHVANEFRQAWLEMGAKHSRDHVLCMERAEALRNQAKEAELQGHMHSKQFGSLYQQMANFINLRRRSRDEQARFEAQQAEQKGAYEEHLAHEAAKLVPPETVAPVAVRKPMNGARTRRTTRA